MAHATWHEESAPRSAEPQWKHDVADVWGAINYYTLLGLYDPTMPFEVKAWKMKGFTWAGAVGMTSGRLMLMFVGTMMIIDPADKHPWGLAETAFYQENIEPVYDVPGDFWDWLGVESGRGILG